MKIDKSITQFAYDVHSRAHQEYEIDPFTIITIISLIVNIIKFIMEFYNNDMNKTVDLLQDPPRIFKWILWRYVYRKVGDKQEAKAIYNAMLNVASETSISELKYLITSSMETK